MKTIAHIQQQESIPAVQACLAAGVPYSTHKRWKAKHAAGQPPIGKPGPSPTEPLDEEKVTARILSLAHCLKRTHGTTELYEELRDEITRRELQERVKAARDKKHTAKAETTRHLEWSQPGSVLATDTTEVVIGDQKHHVQTIRDLASRYTIAPHTDHVPTDEEVASMLDKEFERHGPPLFLKRDNGSNENGPATADVLAKWWVFPINSPVAYPQYNGAVERAQDEIQDALADVVIPAPCPPAHAAAHIGRVAHELNHKHRASLKGKCSCELFLPGRKRAIVSRRQRKEVAEELVKMAVVALVEIEEPTKRDAQKAWRRAVEEWLLDNGYVTEKNKEVLPIFFARKGL